MDVGFLSLLALGLVLGVKHAVEPDHVVAVSAIAARSKNLFSASLAGIFWGIGHTATLFAVGLALIVTKTEIPDRWAMSMEFLVGAMIVILGAGSLLSAVKNGRRASGRAEVRPASGHLKTMMVGIVHGLAGSAALALLVMSLMDGLWQGALFILFFGLGTVIGMLAATTVIGLPFVRTADRSRLNRHLIGLAGAASVLFGLFYMHEIGLKDGLFALWVR